MEAASKYKTWSKANLLLRIAELETGSTTNIAETEHSKAQQQSSPPKAKGKQKESSDKGGIDFAKAPTRKIALRFSYDGALYSGLAAQTATSATHLPTVESVLWHALCKARLVDPELGMDGAEFSRCGRTDKGVSAAGQVVALWVRSRKVNLWHERRQVETLRTGTRSTVTQDATPLDDDDGEELPYVHSLNRILPPTIRVQAWAPVRSTFSARFDCVYRHYKYFFTAGPPSIFFPHTTPAAAANMRLDIELMREAAEKLLGEHDFRNLCKIDASKQITNYRRRIDGVSIDLVHPGTNTAWPTSAVEAQSEPMYVLNLRGTAFLYHQVRNIMAVLFLVGARLESPTVIEELMNTASGRIAADRVRAHLLALRTYADENSNVDDLQSQDLLGGEIVRGLKWWEPVNPTTPLPPATATRSQPTKQEKEQLGLPMWILPALSSSVTNEKDAEMRVYETKPSYEMAADRPLVLWECGFLPTDIQWRVGPLDGTSPTSSEDEDLNTKTASMNLLRLHKEWVQLAISAEVTRHFVLASASAHTGEIAARTRFQDACFPRLATTTPVTTTQIETGTGFRTIPLGNGDSKGAHGYPPLSTRAREMSFGARNAKWLDQNTRKRAAAASLLTQTHTVEEEE